MSQGISLQALIDQVKKELLKPTGSPDYPLFFIEKLEIDLAVTVTQSTTGEIGIAVLDVVSGRATKHKALEDAHRVKVVLTPILSQEERKGLLYCDERLVKQIAEISRRTLSKGSELEGLPE